MSNHQFISYSSVDAEDFAIRLNDELKAGPPSIPVWLDKRDIRPVPDWDEQVAEAIRTCDSLIFVMTYDSVEYKSVCKLEWTRALKYKKPIIPVLLHDDVDIPFRLENRQYIDFTDDFNIALAKLRNHLKWLSSPEGMLQVYKDRLEDAQHDLRRAQNPMKQTRIEDDITLLEKQISEQQRIVDNPQRAAKRVERSITRGIERERQPGKPLCGWTRVRFINHPPCVAPVYFQDRHVETKLIGDFLLNDVQRMMTIVGRAGTGKTAMVCRLLKALERGELPDDGGPLKVGGIVYLSETGSYRINVSNIYTDLCRLLPDDTASVLENIFKNPKSNIKTKMQPLLEAFPQGKVILLLDNLEDLIDPETHNISNIELDEALHTFLSLPQHAVKVILTTRIAPHDLLLVQPAQQARIDLDEGLESPYAENILHEMDADGKVGLQSASYELLDRARRSTRGNPRALEALFAILSADRHTSLEEILDETAGMPKNVVEALVGEAFNRLDTWTQQVMQALAVYDQPIKPIAVDYLLQPYLPGVDSVQVLNRLVNMKFVSKESRRYYLHQIDSDYALSRVPKGEVSDREEINEIPFTQYALFHCGANFFKKVRTPEEGWKTIEDLNPQLAEFDLHCAGEDYDTAAGVLLEIDFDYLLLWGHYQLMTELHERLRDKLRDPYLKQRSVGNLGLAYYSMGQYQRAISCYNQALVISKEIGDRRGEEANFGNLGLAYSDLGQVEKAIEYYNQALEISKEIGDRRGEGTGFGNLGIAYRRLGQIEKAIEYYDQALEILKEIGDRRGEESNFGNLGLAYSDLGQVEKAIEYYNQALAISKEIGDRRGEGTVLGNLGIAYRHLGQIEKAIEYYDQALEISKEIGDRRGEGIRLGNLGLAYSLLGQIKKAIEYYDQALEISKEIGDRRNEGVHLSNLGLAYSLLGQIEKAIEYYNQALEISKEIGDRRGEGIWLGNLGIAYRHLGQIEKAIKYYDQAIEIADEIGHTQLQNWARYGLALTHLYSGDLPAARIACESARQYDLPKNNHNVLALLGVISLRQGNPTAAKEAFTAAITSADALLGHSKKNYDALDTRGLALCGLALCEDDRNHIPDAINAYTAARAINKDAGIVGGVLRLFDEMAKADSKRLLTEVRNLLTQYV